MNLEKKEEPSDKELEEIEKRLIDKNFFDEEYDDYSIMEEDFNDSDGIGFYLDDSYLDPEW